MAGVAALQGVDDTLVALTRQAVTPLPTTVDVTVGPLDRDDDRLRLNWFLYRVVPNTAFRNMEPPRTGWHTAYGFPPLALGLHYLLTAHAGALTQNGEEDQFAHRALGATMAALHEHRVIDAGDPLLSSFAAPLVEPLRITLDDLDLEGLTNLWTSANTAIRLSVGYQVSLVIIDSTARHVGGPPVRDPRVLVVPSLGPRLSAIDPQRIWAGAPFRVAATGLTSGTNFTLGRVDGDPAGPAGGWALTPSPVAVPPGDVALALPAAQASLPAGPRSLDAVALVDGLPAARDQLGLTLVPAVTAPVGAVARSGTVSLVTAHAAPDVEVFLNGAPVPAGDVTPVSATQVDVTVPPTAAVGTGTITLRAAKVAGPDAEVTIT